MFNLRNIKQNLIPTFASLFVKEFADKWMPRLNDNVLNIGAGYRSYRDLAADKLDFTTVDIQRCDDTDVQASVYELPFGEGSFTAVVATEIFEHLQDPRSALEEIHRVLGDGGHLLVTVPFLFRVHGDPEDYYRYTADGMRVLLDGLFLGEIVSYGNRFTVVMDILTTSGWKWYPGKFFRLLNRGFFPLVRKIRNPYFPSGIHMVLRKI